MSGGVGACGVEQHQKKTASAQRPAASATWARIHKLHQLLAPSSASASGNVAAEPTEEQLQQHRPNPPPTAFGNLKVSFPHPSVGAVVEDFDCAAASDHDEATIVALKTLWEQRHVLVFRGQKLGPRECIDFTGRFGKVSPVGQAFNQRNNALQRDFPEIYQVSTLDDDAQKVLPRDSLPHKWLETVQVWHTDNSFRKMPPLGSSLYAVEAPEDIGRDGSNRRSVTSFADCAAAYAALPDSEKRDLQGLKIVHSFAMSQAELLREHPRLTRAQMEEIYPGGDGQNAQALVRTSQTTGRKSLFLGLWAHYIEGMPEEQSRALIQKLEDWATQDRFVYHHEWQTGDLLFWDNRTTMHKLQPFDQAHNRRHMWRVTILGGEKVV